MILLNQKDSLPSRLISARELNMPSINLGAKPMEAISRVGSQSYKDHSLQVNFTLCRTIDPCNEVEDGSFSCPVRSNRASYLTWFNLQVIVVYGP